MAEEEFVVVTIIATKSYEMKDQDGTYNDLQIRKNNDLKAIRAMGFEVEVEDEQ